jgi:hypothetical protein
MSVLKTKEGSKFGAEFCVLFFFCFLLILVFVFGFVIVLEGCTFSIFLIICVHV